jgi:hypothetical protein
MIVFPASLHSLKLKPTLQMMKKIGIISRNKAYNFTIKHKPFNGRQFEVIIQGLRTNG